MESYGSSSHRLDSSPSILLTCQHLGALRATDAPLPRRKSGQRDGGAGGLGRFQFTTGKSVLHPAPPAPTPARPPALFLAPGPAVKGQSLFCRVICPFCRPGSPVDLRQNGFSPPNSPALMQTPSLQKPPRLISASIKSLWLLLRLHFLLLDHEK